MGDSPKDLAAQSVVISEDGEASLVIQTTDGKKFSCLVTEEKDVASETDQAEAGTEDKTSDEPVSTEQSDEPKEEA